MMKYRVSTHHKDMWFYGKLIHKNLSSESNNSGLFFEKFYFTAIYL